MSITFVSHDTPTSIKRQRKEGSTQSSGENLPLNTGT